MQLGISESHDSLIFSRKCRMNIDQGYQLADCMRITMGEVYQKLKNDG